MRRRRRPSLCRKKAARIAQMLHFRAKAPSSSWLFPGGRGRLRPQEPRFLSPPPLRSLHFPIKVVFSSFGRSDFGRLSFGRRRRAIYTHGIASAGFLKEARPLTLSFLNKKGLTARFHLVDGETGSSVGDVSSTPKLFPMRPLRRRGRPSSYTGFMVGNICSIRRKLAKLCELRGPERGLVRGSKGTLSNLKAQLELLS